MKTGSANHLYEWLWASRYRSRGMTGFYNTKIVIRQKNGTVSAKLFQETKNW
jgi:hypothetical protein